MINLIKKMFASKSYENIVCFSAVEVTNGSGWIVGDMAALSGWID